MNVLFVLFLTGMGGSERLVHSLVSRLDKDRFRPLIAWFGEGDPLDEFVRLNVPLFHLEKSGRGVSFLVMREIGRIIEDEEIDVVNAQHFMPALHSFFGCRLRRRAPMVFTAHSEWEIEGLPWRWRIAGGVLARRMEVCVGVGPKITYALRRTLGIDVGNTCTIENGVDIERFCPGRDAVEVRTRLGIEKDEFVVGITANFRQIKNHILLFEAFSILAESCESARLVLIGTGYAASEDNTEGLLRRYVLDKKLGQRVLFLGARSDVAEVLAALDVFCLTSFKEGLPIGLIEAMASALPVIGTNVEGIRDVITHGQDGLLVGLGDTNGLASALRRVWLSVEERERLGVRARRTAEQRYSLTRCVHDYERLFGSLASPPISGG